VRNSLLFFALVLWGCGGPKHHLAEVTTDCLGAETLVETYVWEVHECNGDCVGIIHTGEPQGEGFPNASMIYRSWPEGEDDYMLWYGDEETTRRCVLLVADVGESVSCSRPSGDPCTMSVVPLD
jgi:hypothetical protein